MGILLCEAPPEYEARQFERSPTWVESVERKSGVWEGGFHTH